MSYRDVSQYVAWMWMAEAGPGGGIVSDPKISIEPNNDQSLPGRA
jgi:hypothetical protein